MTAELFMQQDTGSRVRVALIGSAFGAAALVLFGLPLEQSLLFGLLAFLAARWYGVLARRTESFAERLERRQPPSAQRD
jgi:hypothetical protein